MIVIEIRKTWNNLLNIFAKPKRGDNLLKMPNTVISPCQWPLFMTLNACLKFHVNIFDSYLDTKNILLNIFMCNADADAMASTIALLILRIVKLKRGMAQGRGKY